MKIKEVVVFYRWIQEKDDYNQESTKTGPKFILSNIIERHGTKTNGYGLEDKQSYRRGKQSIKKSINSHDRSEVSPDEVT